MSPGKGSFSEIKPGKGSFSEMTLGEGSSSEITPGKGSFSEMTFPLIVGPMPWLPVLRSHGILPGLGGRPERGWRPLGARSSERLVNAGFNCSCRSSVLRAELAPVIGLPDLVELSEWAGEPRTLFELRLCTLADEG